MRAPDPADRHELLGIIQGRARRSVGDLEHQAAIAPGAGRPDDRPESARDAALPADHLADVVGRDAEAEDDDVSLVDALDPNGVGLVDEPRARSR